GESFLPAGLGPTQGDTHSLPEADDDETRQEVEHPTDEIAGLLDAEPATRFDEEVIDRDIAEDRGEQRGPIAAEPDGHGDCPVEGGERQVLTQGRVEPPAEDDRRGDGQDRHPEVEELLPDYFVHVFALVPAWGLGDLGDIPFFKPPWP